MENIRIYCENTSSYVDVAFGTSLNEIAPEGSIAVLVDNKLKSLDYKIISPHNIRFVDYGHPDGRRAYIRSLSFVLQNVVREMFPGKVAISINEASDVLGINRNTLYDATKRLRNPLPSQRVNRKRIVIPLAGLARWLC